MRIKIKDIRPNPFRDFSLYPIDDEQVLRLSQSMDNLGFFSGVTARHVDGGGYELAAGHHRLEAAQRTTPPLTHIEAVVEPYNDQQMVEIMMTENLTQRGHNAASVLDSVAAYVRLVAKDVLLGDGATTKILVAAGQDKLSTAQTKIAKNGPGTELLYRAMNGFTKETRRANKEAEIVKSSDIDSALTTLREGGVMGRIMGEVHAEVEAIRTERAEAERAAREKVTAAAEAKRIAEEKRQIDEVKRRRKAEAKANEEQAKAKERDAKARAEAAEKAKKAEADRKAAEAKQAEQRKAAAAARDAEAKAKAERAKAEAVYAEKREKERAAIKAQRELEAVYDPRCANVFRLPSHEKVFREAMLSENGKRFIPKDQQLALAKQIRSEIDAVETKTTRDLGSVTINSMIDAHLSKVIGLQREIDKQEKENLLRASAQARVEEHWASLRRNLATAETVLGKIVAEQESWKYETALFPMHLDDIQRIIDIGKKMEKLKKALGY